MEYENYECLDEQFDVKDEMFQNTDEIIAEEVFCEESDPENLFGKIQYLQSRLEDLEEKIEQKYNSLARKQDTHFSIIMVKLNWIQKHIVENRKSSVIESVEPEHISIEVEALQESPSELKDTISPQKLESYRKVKPTPVKRVISQSPLKKARLEGSISTVKSLTPKPQIKSGSVSPQFDPARILKTKPLVKTMKDMEEFEGYLQIPGYRAEVLKNVMRLGGTTMQMETLNVLKTLLSNVVQAHYTYQGLRKGKENFSLTHTWDIVRECIQTRHPTATKDEIRKVVMDSLRNAPGRIKIQDVLGNS